MDIARILANTTTSKEYVIKKWIDDNCFYITASVFPLVYIPLLFCLMTFKGNIAIAIFLTTLASLLAMATMAAILSYFVGVNFHYNIFKKKWYLTH